MHEHYFVRTLSFWSPGFVYKHTIAKCDCGAFRLEMMTDPGPDAPALVLGTWNCDGTVVLPS